MAGVLVTGANGYIGNGVVNDLRRSGLNVFGLIRSEQQRDSLLSSEIIPVLGGMDNIEEWATEEFISQIDVVVDTATTKDAFPSSVSLIDKLKQAGEKQKKTKKYIYTSGCLVYGDKKGVVNGEDSERTPPPFIQWRKDAEDQILSLSSQGVATTVVRPGFVYGGHGGKYAVQWFKQGEADKIVVKGNPKKRYGWIHVDDLAAAYTLLSQKEANVIGGQAYNIGDDTDLEFSEVVTAMGRAAGGKGEVTFEDPIVNDPFSSFVDLDCFITSDKLKALGWTPSHKFLPDLHKYYLSWKAANK